MTLSTDPDFHLKLAEFRRKAANNTISLDEMRAAVVLMRQGRIAAAAASTTKARKASSTPANGDSLLAELEGL